MGDMFAVGGCNCTCSGCTSCYPTAAKNVLVTNTVTCCVCYLCQDKTTNPLIATFNASVNGKTTFLLTGGASNWNTGCYQDGLGNSFILYYDAVLGSYGWGLEFTTYVSSISCGVVPVNYYANKTSNDLVSYQCSPSFSAVFQITATNVPWLYALGVTQVEVQSLSGAPNNCTTNFTGCAGIILANYAIDIYASSGGALLLSVTTDSSGFAYLGSGGTLLSGSVWIESHDGRFSGQTFTLPLSTVGLTALGSGYICSIRCAVPLPATLHWTGPSSTATITWVSSLSVWQGCCTPSLTVASGKEDIGGVCTVTAGITVPSAIVFDGTNVWSIWPCTFLGYPEYDVPGSCGNIPYSGSFTELDACSGTNDQTPHGGAFSCYPFNASGTLVGIGATHGSINPVPGAWTLTE